MDQRELTITLKLKYVSKNAFFTLRDINEILSHVVDGLDYWREDRGLMPNHYGALTTGISAEAYQVEVSRDIQ